MIIALTGTPGTGKTTVSSRLKNQYKVLDINRLIEDGMNIGTDPDRGSLIADVDALREYVHDFDKTNDTDVALAVGHVSHLLDPDVVIVLKADPGVLRERLQERRFNPAKVEENMEAEIMDIILVEAVEHCEKVFVVDTSNRRAEDIVKEIEDIVETCRK